MTDEPTRTPADLPVTWHGAYCEYHSGGVLTMGEMGKPRYFTDADELWLFLMEQSKSSGAINVDARLPRGTHYEQREAVSALVSQYKANGGTVTQCEPDSTLRRQPVDLTNLILELPK